MSQCFFVVQTCLFSFCHLSNIFLGATRPVKPTPLQSWNWYSFHWTTGCSLVLGASCQLLTVRNLSVVILLWLWVCQNPSCQSSFIVIRCCRESSPLTHWLSFIFCKGYIRIMVCHSLLTFCSLRDDATSDFPAVVFLSKVVTRSYPTLHSYRQNRYIT